VSPVKYKLGFYVPEDGILHSHRRQGLTTSFVVKLLALQLPVPSGFYQVVSEGVN
jgi:hypothetical protein